MQRTCCQFCHKGPDSYVITAAGSNDFNDVKIESDDKVYNEDGIVTAVCDMFLFCDGVFLW